jgi:hypothetical protein
MKKFLMGHPQPQNNSILFGHMFIYYCCMNMYYCCYIYIVYILGALGFQ